MIYKPQTNNGGQPTGSLCAFCRHSVPNNVYGCEWSDLKDPVNGWDAIPTIITENDEPVIRSYCVLSCPKYIPEKIRFSKHIGNAYLGLCFDDGTPVTKDTTNRLLK